MEHNLRTMIYNWPPCIECLLVHLHISDLDCQFEDAKSCYGAGSGNQCNGQLAAVASKHERSIRKPYTSQVCKFYSASCMVITYLGVNCQHGN